WPAAWRWSSTRPGATAPTTASPTTCRSRRTSTATASPGWPPSPTATGCRTSTGAPCTREPAVSERGITVALKWLAALLAAACLAQAQAAVPHENAVPAYAEEQTILQREKDLPEPGWGSLQSGRRHFERNYLGQGIGRDSEQDLI